MWGDVFALWLPVGSKPCHGICHDLAFTTVKLRLGESSVYSFLLDWIDGGGMKIAVHNSTELGSYMPRGPPWEGVLNMT